MKRTVGDILFDMVPAPVYRAYRWIKGRPQAIKWYRQRANGKLPICDSWDYKRTLVDNICQGLDYLTMERACIWWPDEKKKRRNDLIKAKRTFYEIRWYLDNVVIICKSQEEADERNRGASLVFYMTEKEYAEFEKRKKEAFAILDEYLYNLWW